MQEPALIFYSDLNQKFVEKKKVLKLLLTEVAHLGIFRHILRFNLMCQSVAQRLASYLVIISKKIKVISVFEKRKWQHG